MVAFRVFDTFQRPCRQGARLQGWFWIPLQARFDIALTDAVMLTPCAIIISYR